MLHNKHSYSRARERERESEAASQSVNILNYTYTLESSHSPLSQCPHRAAWPSVLDQAGQQLEEEEKERIERSTGREGEREGREKYKTYG